MFHYFPDNYGWSLSVSMALNMGGELSEIDEICAPLRPLATRDDAEAMSWFSAWSDFGHKLRRYADVDADSGHGLTASRKYLRAALYLMIGERQVVRKTDETQAEYREAVTCFRQGVELSGRTVEWVDVPFGSAMMPAILVPAESATGQQAPAVVHFGGLDVNKELIYLWRAYELTQRGVTVLIVDHPGLGEAVRFRNLYASHDIEASGSACYDYLSARPAVDPERIGIMGVSLGGYYAPRIAAMDPRFACCVLWGAIWSMPYLFSYLATQERPAMSVPLDEQFRFIMGAATVEDAREQLEAWELEPIMDRIRCPILVAHGALDQQAPLDVAIKTYDAAVNSPRRLLRIFTPEEGGAEHCQIDNSAVGTDAMFDWIADVFGTG